MQEGSRPLTDFEVRHPRCVGSITKNFCVLHNTVEYNYISSSNTLGLQLHVSALYVGHSIRYVHKQLMLIHL